VPDPWFSWQRLRWLRGDPPSGHRRIRQSAFARRLPAIAPAPQQKGGDAGAFRGELQSAARHHGERSDFTDYRGDAWGAQPLFHSPQDLGIARCSDQHDPPGIKPARRESWAVKVWARQAPQHHPHPTPTLSAPKGGKGG
jgi:hypothetical protein